MGLSSRKSTTKTDQTQSGTSAPITPDWLRDGARDYVDRIAAFGDSDPNAFVAGASPLQQAAWANVGSLGAWQDLAATGAGLALDAGQRGPHLAGHYPPPPDAPGYAMPRSGRPIGADNPALTGAGQMGAYANPFDQQVIDVTLAGMDRNAGQVRAAQEAAAARTGAFGGSRNAIREALTEGELAQARAAQEAGLRQAGFNTAAALGMQDAAAGNQMMAFDAGQADKADARKLEAGKALGDMANSGDAGTRADLGLMDTLGQDQRSIEQAYALAPLAQLQAMGSLSGMTPYQILVGQQTDTKSSGTNVTKTSPSLFDQLLTGASIASKFL